MNERMKILDLLSQGKITAEQADMLLDALMKNESQRDRQSHGENRRTNERVSFSDRFSLSELKNIGNQVSAAVSQSLGDMKRAMEQQFDQWGISGPTVSVSHQLAVPLEVTKCSIETTNGKIQFLSWEEPYVRIDIRATMRTHNLEEGKRSLQEAMQINHDHDRYELLMVHGFREGDAAALLGAHLDVYVPKHLQKVHVRTRNGSIHVDTVKIEELFLHTSNGSVVLTNAKSTRLHVETDNGNVHMYRAIEDTCKRVYVQTRNGTINVEGIPSELPLAGAVRAGHGRIDIQHPGLTVEFDDGQRKSSARIRSQATADSAAETTQVHLETKNGLIQVRT